MKSDIRKWAIPIVLLGGLLGFLILTSSQHLLAQSFEADPSPGPGQNYRQRPKTNDFNFRLEIEGVTVGSFRNVSGLKEGEDQFIRKRPGGIRYSEITMTQGDASSDSLYEWYKRVSVGQFERKDMSLVLQDNSGNEARRWNLYGSLPTRLTWLNHPQGGGSVDDRVGIAQMGFEVEEIEKVVIPQTGPLDCPVVPENPVVIPELPYEEDCELIGQAEEIEAYLQGLEAIAADCLARREAAWQAVLDARVDLDEQIDTLPSEDASPDLGRFQRSPPLCSNLDSIEPLRPSSGPFPPEGEFYTTWLRNIGEDVARYCQMIDELIEPLAESCENMNEEIDCNGGGVLSEGERASFHARLGGVINGATLLYEYTDFFYTTTLGQYSFGNFREYFNEDVIDCKLSRPNIPRRRDIFVVPDNGPRRMQGAFRR